MDAIIYCSQTGHTARYARLLAEAAGTGEWLEGARFSYGTEETEVQDWVRSLADAIAQAQAGAEN